MSRKDDSPECECSLRFRECEARRNRIFYKVSSRHCVATHSAFFDRWISMRRIT